MRYFVFAALLSLHILPSQTSAASGGDYWSWSCGELWHSRNAIYHRARYCFKTDRAITVFGNAGCVFDREADVPFSRSDRRALADIQRVEAAKGCRN